LSYRLLSVLFAVFGATAGLAEAQAAAPSPRPRPRVAVALSGGGARGIAHIGALRALEEAGIPVDALAANSMGAVVGGIYATGQTADQLERIVKSMDWAALFSGRPDRRTLPVVRRADRYAPTVGISFDWKGARIPAGLVAEHRVNRFLIQYLSPAGYAAGGDFDRLPIAFRAMAGDLSTGDPVVLAQGDLARAVRASMSIPLLFPPVDWDGRRLVDGLIVDNLPVEAAKAFGAPVLIAIDIGSPPMERTDYESALGVASQVSDLLMRRRYRDFAAEADVVVRPDLGRHSSTDYSDFDALIQKAYEATVASLPAIREKLAAAGIEDLQPHAAPPSEPALEGAAIAAVRIEGSEDVSERLARRTFNIPVGPPFAMTRGLKAFDKIDASSLFERTWLEFARAGDGVDVVLRVKDAAPNRAEVALGYSEWEKARGAIRLRNQNTFGFGEEVGILLAASDAESRVELSLRGERLLLTGLGHRITAYTNRDKPRFFTADGEEDLGRARFSRQGVEAALHSSIERWGFVEAGMRFGQVATSSRGLDLVETSDQVGALFGQVTMDTLDDLAWPEHGGRLSLLGEWSLSDLGADREYWRVEVDGRAGRPLAGRLAAEIHGRLGLSGNDLALYDWYRVGGVEMIPGYHHEELKGAQTFAAALSLRYRLFGQLRALARVGAGNVFARTADMTLDDMHFGVGFGLYHPSRIGPVSWEIGSRDDGGMLTTLTIGWN
jgi:NTE family protein